MQQVKSSLSVPFSSYLHTIKVMKYWRLQQPGNKAEYCTSVCSLLHESNVCFYDLRIVCYTYGSENVLL